MDSKEKYQAVGLQFVSLDFKRNIVACIAFSQLDAGTAVPVSNLIRKSVEALDLVFEDAVGASQQDGNAVKVARELGLEEVTCLMHSGDKVGASAIGDLTRSRNKQIQNAFDTGQDLVDIARGVAKHFSYGTRCKNLAAACTKAGVRSIKPRLDVNGTRVGAKFNLLHSVLILEKALRQYDLDQGPGSITLPTEAEWQALREMEAILSVTQQLCMFAQTEMYVMSCQALGPLVLLITSYKRCPLPFLLNQVFHGCHGPGDS